MSVNESNEIFLFWRRLRLVLFDCVHFPSGKTPDFGLLGYERDGHLLRVGGRITSHGARDIVGNECAPVDHWSSERTPFAHGRADIRGESADLGVGWTYCYDVRFSTFSDKFFAATAQLQVAPGSLDQVAGFFFVDPAFLVEP